MSTLSASRDQTIVIKSLMRALNLCDKNKMGPYALEVVATAFFLLGQVLGLMHCKSGSILAYQRALDVSPNDISFLVALANAIRTRNEAGDLDEAIKVYLKAVSLDPASAQLYRHVGSAYMQKGCIPEAIGAFTRSVALSVEGDEWVPQVNAIIKTLTDKLRSHQQGQIIVDLP
jgi:cytochrome c-type biogenesis protein CcmH/NrfG